MHNDELPYEVILAIERVLEISPVEQLDQLDGLSQDFNPVTILNDFFPDGTWFPIMCMNMLKVMNVV